MLGGLTAVWLAWPTSGLRAANFSQLRPGMTRPEVERLLGGPPGDYGHFADGIVDYGDGSVLQVFAAPDAGDAKPETWTDGRNHFYVFFNNIHPRDAQIPLTEKQSSSPGGIFDK